MINIEKQGINKQPSLKKNVIHEKNKSSEVQTTLMFEGKLNDLFKYYQLLTFNWRTFAYMLSQKNNDMFCKRGEG